MALATDEREAHTARVAREDVEGMRRRLYAPGASTADVDRYRGLGVVQRAVPLEDRRQVLRRRPRILVPAVVAALVLSGIAVATGAARSAIPVVVPVVRAPTAIAIGPGDRETVVEALGAQDDVTVAGFLLDHRATPELLTATRSLLVEQSGIGSATVQVDPESASAFRGRATVLLVLDRSVRAGWTTYWRRVEASGALTLERQQQRAGQQPAGGLTAATYRYGSGEQPVEVKVQAPTGVRWAVEIVFTD